MKKFKVYAKINSDSYITAIDSSAFLTDLIDWLEIDEGSGDKFHHAQGNYFDKPLKPENGVYQYKLEDGTARECTAEELAEQEAEENSIEQQIAELKSQLSATDYKIIKCSEAQLVGDELPYDIVALHEERQAIRDRINELEGI